MPRFSQVFLADTKICARICHALDGETFEHLVEIGPGAGALTGVLFPKYAEIMEAIEIDRNLVPVLEKKFPGLKINNSDFMRVDLEKELPAGRIAFISNLPYDCSTVILDKILSFPRLACAVFMFQKEVGIRIQAVPDSPEYGVLSVSTSLRATSETVCFVKAGSFRPVPAVDSAVLKFRPVKHDENINRTINLVKKAFSHRRKTLVNSLVLCGMDRNKILSAFKTMNIQERVRAQELSAGMYSELAALL